MNKDYTDITIILDRSGSMQSCKEEAETGIRTFIAEQKTTPGTTLLSVLQFDDRHDWVYRAVNINEIDEANFCLEPRGMTAMYDAIGKAVTATGERLAAMPEEDRPGLVVVMIVTDGAENSSQHYKVEEIRKLIEDQQNYYSWQFTFLGANQDAITAGGKIGIAAHSSATYATKNSDAAMRSASANVSRMKMAAQNSGTVFCAYTNEERDGMVNGPNA